MSLTHPFAHWEVPFYSHGVAETHFREKVEQLVGPGNSGYDETAAHAILAYVDVLRQRINELEEAVNDIVTLDETALRAIVQDELNRHGIQT